MKASVAYYDLKILERQQQDIHRLKYLLETKMYEEISDKEIELLKELYEEKNKRFRAIFDAMDKVQIHVED